ncbi:MAG: ring-cleaving dioxygenase [Chloroflexi bacterium]|nr:ring-cleaving dioxygenase [Chloroflexota bacterium]
MELGGLHHLTAVTAHAADNVAFYTRVLGLRLVKKTVNQDDVSAYHLFYADAAGSAGADVTFFDWAMAVRYRAGAGEIAATGLRVAGRAALDWWADWLRDHDVTTTSGTDPLGRSTLTFTDPEGQRLLLVDDTSATVAAGVPWAGSPVPPEQQIRGLATVTLVVARLAPTVALLTGIMGFRQVWHAPGANGAEEAVFACGPGGPGAEVRVVAAPGLPPARPGHGGVHHVAFRVPTDAAHQQWQAHLRAARVGVTPVIDRFYFRSLYFREPGGILFEIATDGPGFATDEHPEHLGERLALPPFLEPRRAEIEAGLRPL